MARVDVVRLAGVPLRSDAVFALIGLLTEAGFGDLATTLERAQDSRLDVFALTIAEREMVLRALDDPPSDDLARFRSVLLREHEWRVREGLV